MSVYEFELVASAVLDDHSIDALFEAGCGDATFGDDDGVVSAMFAREAPTLTEAVMSAHANRGRNTTEELRTTLIASPTPTTAKRTGRARKAQQATKNMSGRRRSRRIPLVDRFIAGSERSRDRTNGEFLDTAANQWEIAQ